MTLALQPASTLAFCIYLLHPTWPLGPWHFFGTDLANAMRINSAAAIWQCKCPKCREGDMFTHPAISFRFAEMFSACPKCGVSLMPEPGFYFGALYVSYAFTIALMIGTWLFLYLFFNPPDWVFGVALVLSCILFIPFSFRYSRVLFLYWFGGEAYRV